MIALIVRRRCRGGTLAAGRQASISGASTSHCSSVRPIAPSSKPEERPSRPRVQALTGPSLKDYLSYLDTVTFNRKDDNRGAPLLNERFLVYRIGQYWHEISG